MMLIWSNEHLEQVDFHKFWLHKITLPNRNGNLLFTKYIFQLRFFLPRNPKLYTLMKKKPGKTFIELDGHPMIKV